MVGNATLHVMFSIIRVDLPFTDLGNRVEVGGPPDQTGFMDQIDPLAPSSTNTDQVDPIAPPSTNTDQVDPIAPPSTNTDQVDPIAPPSTNTDQVDPIAPPSTNTDQVDPLAPPSTNTDQVDPIAPPSTNTDQVDPIAPPSTNTDQVDPLAPPSTNTDQVDPLAPPSTTSNQPEMVDHEVQVSSAPEESPNPSIDDDQECSTEHHPNGATSDAATQTPSYIFSQQQSTAVAHTLETAEDDYPVTYTSAAATGSGDCDVVPGKERLFQPENSHRDSVTRQLQSRFRTEEQLNDFRVKTNAVLGGQGASNNN